MAATETGAGLAAAAFLYVVKIVNGRATYGEFAHIIKNIGLWGWVLGLSKLLACMWGWGLVVASELQREPNGEPG